MENLSDQIFNDALIPVITEQYNIRIKEAHKVDDSHLIILRKKVRELGQKIDNIVNLMAESGSGALMTKLRELEGEYQNAQALIDKLTRRSCEYISEDFIRELFIKGRQLLENRSLPSLKKLIQLFVDKVVIYPERVHVLFNFGNSSIPQYPTSSNDDIAVYDTQTHSLEGNTVKVGGGELPQSLAVKSFKKNTVIIGKSNTN